MVDSFCSYDMIDEYRYDILHNGVLENTTANHKSNKFYLLKTQIVYSMTHLFLMSNFKEIMQLKDENTHVYYMP